jgi:anti-sigma B factor antagonist
MLDITDHAVGDVTVLTLKGRLVLEDAEMALGGLLERLFMENRPKVVLDLQDVTYIDSEGLGLLVAKYVGARRRGGDLRLVHLTARSTHLMDITKLAGVFGIFESQADAVASFESP